MKEVEVNIDEFVVDSAIPNMKSYFGRVVSGNDQEYRTDLFKGQSVQDVLNAWLKHLVPLEHKWPSLYAFEIDLARKVGPMSIMKPLKDRMDEIESYWTTLPVQGTSLVTSPIREGITRVLKEFKPCRGLSPRSQWHTVSMMKLSTNSGTPYFTKRRLVVDRTLPASSNTFRDSTNKDLIDVYIQARNKTHLVKKAAAVLGWRGQEGGPTVDDVKQRTVWMFPFGVNVLELTVYQPLIETCQNHDLVAPWNGNRAVDERITKLFDSKKPDDLIVCTDFTKFDQHMGGIMREVAAEILTHILNRSPNSYDWLNNVFPIKYEIPLLLDGKRALYGEHGLASGSGGTNVDETIAHRYLQHCAAMSVNSELNPHSMCLGDDGILSYPGITVDDVVEVYSQHQQDMNKDKQYASTEDCIFLRRWHHKDYRVGGVCVGVYSTARALGRLCEEERYKDRSVYTDEMVALRQLSILENVKYHPLKEEFVNFVIKGDRNRLGLAIPGFLERIVSVAERSIELGLDIFNYNTMEYEFKLKGVGGIRDWWIVQYLQSLS